MGNIDRISDISALSEKGEIACRLFLAECEREGLNVRITETYRSQERQNYLYAQGRTRPGSIVTWTKTSRHKSGNAWDICKNQKGAEYSDSAFFSSCGKIAKSLGITWGGEWKTPDKPHFEINKNWKNPKEEIDMETLEKVSAELEFLKSSLDRLGDRITKLENPKVYNYIDKNLPKWAEPTVKKLSQSGIIKGNEAGELGLDEEFLRMLVILDRAKLFD